MHNKISTKRGDEYFILMQGNDETVFSDSVYQLFDKLHIVLSVLRLRLNDILFIKFFLSDIANQYSDLNKIINDMGIVAYTSFVGMPPSSGSKVAIEVHIIKSKNKTTVKHLTGGMVVKHNDYATYYVDNSAYNSSNPDKQVKSLFESLNKYALSNGMTVYDNLIRTWIYIRDIDNHYQNLVDGRYEYFFKNNLVPNTHYVSSTGIEGVKEKASCLFYMDSLFIKGLSTSQIDFLSAKEYICPTHQYSTDRSYGNVGGNVTFERGTKVTYGDRSHYYISGTASIDKDGKIIHKKDVLLQAERAFENIKALLKSGGTNLGALAYIVVYLRDQSDYEAVDNYIKSKLHDTAYIIVNGSVCNPSWLVEIDGFAATSVGDNRFPDFF